MGAFHTYDFSQPHVCECWHHRNDKSTGAVYFCFELSSNFGLVAALTVAVLVAAAFDAADSY